MRFLVGLTFLLVGSLVFAQKATPIKPGSELSRLRIRQDQALLKGQQEKELRNELQALELILNNRLRKDGKNELLLRRAFLYFKIGRAKLLSQTNLTMPKADYFKEASRAVFELETLSKTKEIDLTNSQKALLLFIRGSIHQELDAESKMIEDFATAIKIDQKLPQATSMGLILGETYFDKENYREALAWYQKLKNQYDHDQRSVADFKSGWSWLLMKEQKNAQYYFLRVANQKQTESFREDSVKALAYLVSQNRSEAWIVEFAKKSLVDEPLRIVFLGAVIQNSYNIDKTKVPYQLFNELFKRTQAPQAKIKVLVQLITFERREIATMGQKRAFDYLDSLVKKNSQLPWRDYIKETTSLEPDLRGYIQNFSDYYVGNVPNKVMKLDKKVVVDTLHKQLIFFSRNLMTEETKKPTINLWLDLIHREESLPMVNDVIELLSQINPPPHNEIERARLEKLAIVDGQAQKNKELTKPLIVEIESFLGTYPASQEKSRLLNRLAELYMIDSHFDKALPYLQQLFEIQKNETNAYNVIWSLFKMDKFAEVVANPILGSFAKSAKIKEVYRESHLKLAQAAQLSGDESAYQENIIKFLSLNPTQEQSNVVKASFMNGLLLKNDLTGYCAQRASLNEKEKDSKLIHETEELALDKMFLLGPLINCHWSKKKGNSKREFKMILYEKAMRRKLTPEVEKSLFRLNVDQQVLLFSLMAMAEPQKMLQLEFPKKSPEAVKDMIWLALQVSQSNMNPSVPANLEPLVRSKMGKTPQFKNTSTIAKIVKEATFPIDKMKVEKFSKLLEDLIYRSKLVKTKFQKESATLADATKRDVLELASDFERKIAQSIRKSPMPEGLTKEELDGYQVELDKAAVDFDKQAEEYDKALGDVKARIWVQEQEAQSEKVPEIKPENWLWQGDEYQRISQNFKEYGAFYTLLKLETSRGQQVLTDLDYARMRGGALLLVKNNDFMRGLIRRELVALNAFNLIDEWKAIK
jgi:hypothetical protein